MSHDKIIATDKAEAVTKYNTMPEDSMSIHGTYHAVCYDIAGNIKWEDDIENLVTTVGKNFTLDTTLGNTAGGAVVMGLKGTGTAVVADTQASHASWLEVGLANAPTYSGNRPTPSFSAASAGSSPLPFFPSVVPRRSSSWQQHTTLCLGWTCRGPSTWAGSTHQSTHRSNQTTQSYSEQRRRRRLCSLSTCIISLPLLRAC